MVGWHHYLYGHELEQALGVDDGQGSLECWSPCGHKWSDPIGLTLPTGLALPTKFRVTFFQLVELLLFFYFKNECFGFVILKAPFM